MRINTNELGGWLIIGAIAGLIVAILSAIFGPTILVAALLSFMGACVAAIAWHLMKDLNGEGK